MDYPPNFENLPLFQLLRGIEKNKKQVAEEQFASNLMQIINSPDADNIKQTAILNLVKTPQQKTGILESIGGLIDMVNPGAPYRGNVATESPILQYLMAGRAGQIFQTPDEKEKTALDLQAKRQSNLSSMLFNRAALGASNINTGNYGIPDYVPSVLNQDNQENGGGLVMTGKGRLSQVKPIDTEMRNAKLDLTKAQTEKNRRVIAKPPSVSQQLFDALDPEQQKAAAEIHAGIVPKAISDEQKEYQGLRNAKLKYENDLLNPLKKQTAERNLGLIDARIAKLKEVKAKTPNAHIDTLNKMLLDATTMTETGATIPLPQDRINPAQIKYIEDRAKLYGYRVVATPKIKTIPGGMFSADTTDTTVSYSLEPIEDGAEVTGTTGQGEPTAPMSSNPSDYAPVDELKPYWKNLPENEKQSITKALYANPKNLAEILRRLQGGR